MTSGHMPGMTPDLHHRFIEGFVPHYFTLAGESSDANFKQKLLPPYPLVLSPGVTSTNNYTGAYPTVMIANEGAALANVILSTDLWHFYSEDSSQTDLGIPNGTPATNTGIDAIIFNGKILTSHPANTRLYHGALNATPSWTASTGTALTATAIHLLEPFLDEAHVVDASTHLGPRHIVRIVAPDYSVSAGIDLGGAWNILDNRNYNDRYAALFAYPSESVRVVKETTCFLWNGVSGSSWDYKVTLKGKYCTSVVTDGVLYAFTQLGQTLVCSRLNGSSFEEVARLRNTVVSTALNIPKTRIATDGDFFIILASSSGNTTAASPLYWKPETGESFYLEKAIATREYKSVLTAIDTSNSVVRYLSYQNSGSVGIVYKVTLENTTKSDIGAEYKSNFIPIPIDKLIHGDAPMGRGKINRIDIEYSTKAPNVNNIMALTLTTKDDNVSETYETFTATVKSTTANSTNATVEEKRAIINNVGVLATEFALDLAVTVATTSWDLIIRRIVIDYTPVAHLS